MALQACLMVLAQRNDYWWLHSKKEAIKAGAMQQCGHWITAPLHNFFPPTKSPQRLNCISCKGWMLAGAACSHQAGGALCAPCPICPQHSGSWVRWKPVHVLLPRHFRLSSQFSVEELWKWQCFCLQPPDAASHLALGSWQGNIPVCVYLARAGINNRGTTKLFGQGFVHNRWRRIHFSLCCTGFHCRLSKKTSMKC